MFTKPPTGKLKQSGKCRRNGPLKQRKTDKGSAKNYDSDTIVGDSEMSMEFNLCEKTQKTGLGSLLYVKNYYFIYTYQCH